MYLLSSQQKKAGRLFFFLSLIFIFFFPIQTVAAKSGQPIRPKNFQQYGFVVKGFSAEQERIIGATLAAFDRELGGHGRLARIMRTYNSGKNWTITYVPDWTGADSSMKLSPTVFSIEKAVSSNYSSYGAGDEIMHAQIVIGHEISHLLLRAVRDITGVKWSENYEQQVTRNWVSMLDKKAPEEEAVTEFSLKILNCGYFFSINADAQESDPKFIAEIDEWAEEFLSTLQKLD